MDERRDLYLITNYPKQSKTLIAKNVTEEEAYKAMRKFWQEYGIKVYYIRYWGPEKGVRRYDFGSHTQFFDWVKGEKNE